MCLAVVSSTRTETKSSEPPMGSDLNELVKEEGRGLKPQDIILSPPNPSMWTYHPISSRTA